MSDLLSRENLKRWRSGKDCSIYEKLGVSPAEKGFQFAVWAPNADGVGVAGDFNNWKHSKNLLRKDRETGIWTGSVSNAKEGDHYKYAIYPKNSDDILLKSDPVAFSYELRPDNASVVYILDKFKWQDDHWMTGRPESQSYNKPLSVYEVHLGSWQREGDKFLSYRELAARLIPYVKEMGFTHIELMPVCEHPYDPSWGYQVTGYFAPTSRHGKPEDFMHFVNECHKAGLGIIMDWVPAHFPKDEHGLIQFDGTRLYEYEHPLKREQKDWDTVIFDYGKAEVKNFLISSACFWCEKYHIDGIRVDAVASMLYLDYSKKEGEWVPNKQGGKEHVEAVDFLKTLNKTIRTGYEGVLTFAEESTAWPGVTAPPEKGGLGFDYKWNMGWMNDTLDYLRMNDRDRADNTDKITFSLMYAPDERYLLPLSHDEVVHLKKPLALKSPGNKHQKLANLKLLFMLMIGHPGKKLLFMGGEFGQTSEWNEHQSLEWNLLQDDTHAGVRRLVTDLLLLYKKEERLLGIDIDIDHDSDIFSWIDTERQKKCIFAFVRQARGVDKKLFFVLNFSGRKRNISMPDPSDRTEAEVLINTDSKYYGGDNTGGLNGMPAEGLTLAPYSGLILSLMGSE